MTAPDPTATAPRCSWCGRPMRRPARVTSERPTCTHAACQRQYKRWAKERRAAPRHVIASGERLVELLRDANDPAKWAAMDDWERDQVAALVSLRNAVRLLERGTEAFSRIVALLRRMPTVSEEA